MTPAAEGPDDAAATGVTPSRSGRLLVLFGVAGLAITQPLLDLFGGNPEFFVATNLSSGQILTLALIVTIVPALLVWAVVAVVARVHPRAGDVAFALGVFGLAALLVMGLLRAAGVEHTALFLAVTTLGAAGLTFLVVRFDPASTFFRYLGVANLAFLALFVFASRSSELLWSDGGDDVEEVRLGESDTPVVWIILDEFPLATMIRADGTINEERFPEFAALAERSTWFRNAASPASLTTNAVPALLTGNVPEKGQLTVYADHPRNAFTMLGSELPVNRYEIVTDLCPASICEPVASGSIRTALVDFGVVLGHRKLPEALRARLPPIDDGWGGFVGVEDEPDVQELVEGADQDDGAPQDPYEKWNSFGPEVRGPQGQVAALEELTSSITPEPAFTMVHVALPHAVWLATPYGDDVFNSVLVRHRIEDPDNPRYAYNYRQMLQIHTLQASATDRKIGELVDHLEEQGMFDDTLLVIAGDHGTSMLPPTFGRRVEKGTADAVLRVPLFIKLPGQETGEIDDRPVSTLDVLPSLADVLDADVDWEFDGHSLFDGSSPHTPRRVSDDLDGLYDVVEETAELFGSSSLDGLAQVGPFGSLVGDRVVEHEVGDDSARSWLVDQRDELRDLPNDDGSMPFVLTGVVDDEPADDLVVAVNGRIVGVATGFVPHTDGRYRWGAYVNDAYRSGANEVVAYEVEEVGDDVVLHPVGTMDR